MLTRSIHAAHFNISCCCCVFTNRRINTKWDIKGGPEWILGCTVLQRSHLNEICPQWSPWTRSVKRCFNLKLVKIEWAGSQLKAQARLTKHWSHARAHTRWFRKLSCINVWSHVNLCQQHCNVLLRLFATIKCQKLSLLLLISWAGFSSLTACSPSPKATNCWT